MMHIDFLLDVFRRNSDRDAVVWRDQTSSYAWLADAVEAWTRFLRDRAVAPGTVVSLEADFSPTSIALLLALVNQSSIIVPLTPSIEAKKPEFREIAQVEATVSVANNDRAHLENTAIEKHRVQLLPTSPTFINLLLASEAYQHHDLSSLELVTYGTEVMPESTLERFHRLFPRVRLQQTYGLSEVGILRAQSKSADSLWVKVGGDGFETRIVDGMLQIRARSAMLGYLNAPSPFTPDGWLPTGDAVDVDGEYFRIRGRQSELINVGGEKVYPAEVESVLQIMEGVKDVTVSGEANPLTGQMVTARVKLATGESLPEFRKRMRLFCRDKLPLFKIPQKVVLVDEAMHGERFKKMRRVS